MENIYEWLYDHCAPDRRTFPGSPFADHARRLLLTGGGSQLDREDAVETLCSAVGTAGFAAGMRLCYRMMTEAGDRPD